MCIRDRFWCVRWHFTAIKDTIPNNSTSRSSPPMKLCSLVKYYETKGWAKFQLHTLQNDCKIAEKLLFCGVCWHFTAIKDMIPNNSTTAQPCCRCLWNFARLSSTMRQLHTTVKIMLEKLGGKGWGRWRAVPELRGKALEWFIICTVMQPNLIGCEWNR